MKEKKEIFSELQSFLDKSGLTVSSIDTDRPWGGFFVIDEKHAETFIAQFFPDLKKEELNNGKLSPKILVVAPHKKLSWQYHFRRSEVWRLIRGEAAVVTSDTDIENEIIHLNKDQTITLKRGERHRLIGLEDWGIVAEIWVHSDPANPSDEADIVRLQDDFGR